MSILPAGKTHHVRMVEFYADHTCADLLSQHLKEGQQVLMACQQLPTVVWVTAFWWISHDRRLYHRKISRQETLNSAGGWEDNA